MDREAQIEQIENYLAGRLSASEKTAFEMRISNEPALAEEVSLHRLFLGGMDRLSETNLKENIKAWIVPVNPIDDNDVNISKKSSQNIKYYLIGIIAVVLTSVVCYWVFQKIDHNKEVELLIKEQKIDSLAQALKLNYRKAFEQQQNLNSSIKLDSLNHVIEQMEKQLNDLKDQTSSKNTIKASNNQPIAALEKQYNAPTDWPSGYRSIDENNDQKSIDVSKAIEYFKNGKLSATEEVSKKILIADPNNAIVHRLLAHTHFRQHNYLTALSDFEYMKNVQNGIYADEAEWNIVLCHAALATIDSGEREIYMKLLKEIANNPNHYYSKNAKDLLKLNK